MSIGPLPPLVSAAGTSLAQVKGSDVERTQQDVTGHERRVVSGEKAENAAGIAATDEDSQTEDRDADGRRLWEDQLDLSQQEKDESAEQEEKPADDRKPPGISGGTTGEGLDITA